MNSCASSASWCWRHRCNILTSYKKSDVVVRTIASIGYNTRTMQQYIVSNPNILDGEPVIVGTRVPVVEILLLLKEGHTISEIQQMYPHVPMNTFERVLEELATTITAQPYRYAA